MLTNYHEQKKADPHDNWFWGDSQIGVNAQVYLRKIYQNSNCGMVEAWHCNTETETAAKGSTDAL